MKYIYLLRHAKSSWKYTHLKDYDRPLKDRGKQDIEKVGRYFAEHLENPEKIYASKAVRATETAKTLGEHIGIPPSEIDFHQELYHATPQTLLRFIDDLAADLNRIMIVGHNPGITDFCNYLQPEFIENIPTSGLAIISCPGNWNELKLHMGTLERIVFPKKLS